MWSEGKAEREKNAVKKKKSNRSGLANTKSGGVLYLTQWKCGGGCGRNAEPDASPLLFCSVPATCFLPVCVSTLLMPSHFPPSLMFTRLVFVHFTLLNVEFFFFVKRADVWC